MSNILEQRLSRLAAQGASQLLHSRIGLEKENLRVSKDGGIAATRHPQALGSALTHPWITTDYSEALLELITPPFSCIDDALDFLSGLHSYVHARLQQEILWATSMPCLLAGGENIPIAVYGNSNAGKMKHIYRVGLGFRYGRVMQVIAGVHFNYSLPDSFWPMYQQLLGDTGDLRAFRDEHYMGLVRNLQRVGWLVPYLFGASPAVCKSFFNKKPVDLDEFDETTYYEPYGTSLRMGDIGYQNHREEGIGIKADYDSLSDYVASLEFAINTPAEAWQEIGVKVDGEYRQLNANILQIENEYYSTVRPKPILDGLEKPSLALKRRGIQYIELRSLDVNAYHPLGVDDMQLYFLEALMLYCLLHESPLISQQERWEIDRNLELVAHQGRDPELKLVHEGRAIPLADWLGEILDEMHPVCELLDRQHGGQHYVTALQAQRIKHCDPEQTPSGRMLKEMRENNEGFFAFSNRLSKSHDRYFANLKISAEREQQLLRETEKSLQKQAAIEASDDVDFDTFLADYFSQQ